MSEQHDEVVKTVEITEQRVSTHQVGDDMHGCEALLSLFSSGY